MRDFRRRVDGRGLGATLAPADVAAIQRQIAPVLTGPITPEAMAPRLLTVAGSDRYEYLTYSMTTTPSPTELLIGVRPKTYGPPLLLPGLAINNIDSTSFAFNADRRELRHHAARGRGLRRRHRPRPARGNADLVPNGRQPTLLWTRASWFHSRPRHDRWFVIGEGGATHGEEAALGSFTLGGPLRLGSFHAGSLLLDSGHFRFYISIGPLFR